MINSKLFKNQSIGEVLDDVKNQVRKKPQDADLRAYLFQLFSLQGAWSKASEQIKLSAEMNEQAQPHCMVYAPALSAEAHREEVFQGKSRPALYGEADEWLALLVAALEDPDSQESVMLREQGLARAPEVRGTLTLANGQRHSFEWIADGDSRLGPVCEVITNGKYGWLPYSQIEKITFRAAEGLSDLVWIQSEVVMSGGRSLAVLVPARYVMPETPQHVADQLQLAQRTEWVKLAENQYQGVGQKMVITDQDDYALLDIREIEFNNI